MSLLEKSLLADSPTLKDLPTPEAPAEASRSTPVGTPQSPPAAPEVPSVSPLESSPSSAPEVAPAAAPDAAVHPNNAAPADTPEVTPKDEAPAEDQGLLDLTVNDYKGFPIPHLHIRILVGKQEVFTGPTNAKGQVSVTLKIGARFEIQVKRDRPRTDGTGKVHEYNLGAIAVMESKEVQAGLHSKSMKFDFSTEGHAGRPGTATDKKQAITKQHNQKPDTSPAITGNPNTKPTLQANRDQQGLPKTTILDGLKDWFGRNGTHTEVPASNHSDLEKVRKLIEFAEKQATWKYDKSVITATYVQRMINKTFVTPQTKPSIGYQNSVHMCNKYVKIALWYAGFGPATEAIGNAISPARLMGPALIEAGFRDVTSKIPDGRWAAPGDIIVYQRKDDPDAAGHIDIRTYDGYLSDFLGKELPVRRFKVTGIYRKHFDPEPEWRMRAFLRIIATRESRAVYDSKGYSETFRTLPGVGILQFNDFSEHPFASANADSTASGAYGITRLTWKSYLPFLDLPEKAQRFTPLVQDRLAISIMEQVGNALAHVRLGELEQAVSILRLKQWPSLPGGAQSNKFTISEMRSLFETFLSELRNGKQ